MRFVLGPNYRRYGRTVVAGSPRRLFRATEAGERQLRDLERGRDVNPSTLMRALVDADALFPEPPSGAHNTSAHNTSAPRWENASLSALTPTHRTDASRRPTSIPTVGGVVAHVVVDDGSEPPVPGATIRLHHNQGPAAARNAGLSEVTSEFVLLIDDDIVENGRHQCEMGWGDLLAHFDDPTVAVVAPRVRSSVGHSVLARYERIHSPLDMGDAPARVRPGGRISYVPSAALVARVAALREVGGFDDELRCGEDVDLVWRLNQSGWKVLYDPRVVVHHAPRASWREWIAQRVGYGTSAAHLDRRHPGHVAPAVVGVSSAATAAAFATRHWVVGGLLAASSGVALAAKLRTLPPLVALSIGIDGHLAALRALLTAVRRAWWPIIAVAALRSSTARRIAIIAAVAGIAHRLNRVRRNNGTRRDALLTPIGLVDDAAYAVGVWKGCRELKSGRAMLPRRHRRGGIR